jgi:hypothetical protein
MAAARSDRLRILRDEGGEGGGKVIMEIPREFSWSRNDD